MDATPWLPDFLQSVKHEYQVPLPVYRVAVPTEEDIAYMEENTRDTQFDRLGLKQDMFQAYEAGDAMLIKVTSSLGSILVLTYEPIPKEQWDEWWHCVRFVSPAKKVRICLFLHPQEREFPPKGQPIGPEHINGGSTFPCDSTTIVVYRKQEVTRVLLHELLHSSCSDPYHKALQFTEADTEAWAELCLIALRTRGERSAFQRAWKQHLQYSADLVRYLEENHRVTTPADYGWRYTKGRFDVWSRLGFTFPDASHRQFQTLALTQG